MTNEIHVCDINGLIIDNKYTTTTNRTMKVVSNSIEMAWHVGMSVRR